ncbi:hypothetical protein, partial [Salmonella enterica]|uniref:hypothetical protein n=1 Tax=Salmonella enterica TaxID=28901 RepID=UPI00111A702A
RDRSGYICDRSEIGQHPPLQRIYSSAPFEQLLTQVCQTWPQHPRNLRQPKTWHFYFFVPFGPLLPLFC